MRPRRSPVCHHASFLICHYNFSISFSQKFKLICIVDNKFRNTLQGTDISSKLTLFYSDSKSTQHYVWLMTIDARSLNGDHTVIDALDCKYLPCVLLDER